MTRYNSRQIECLGRRSLSQSRVWRVSTNIYYYYYAYYYYYYYWL